MNFSQLATPCEDQWLDYHVDGLGGNYDIGPDGRVLMIKEQLASTAEVVLIPHWFEELTRLLPVN